MKSCNFSVAMCVYKNDNAEYFHTAVESVLNQTARPDEVVLIVDGPVTEELNSIIVGYECDPIFRVIRLPQNVGHGKARAAALEKCKYELVALMDADDISVPTRFEWQLEAFRQWPEVSVVGGNIEEFIDQPSNAVGKRIVPEKDEAIKRYMKGRCPFNQMTVMFKKSDVAAVGGYLDWYCDEDYYLWLRLAIGNYKFANIGKILVHARVGKDMYARRGGVRYFKSEAKLQKFMRESGIISYPRYIWNVMQRWILQVLMPNWMRGWVFRVFARS